MGARAFKWGVHLSGKSSIADLPLSLEFQEQMTSSRPQYLPTRNGKVLLAREQRALTFCLVIRAIMCNLTITAPPR